jgi:hypothetical protein
MSERITYMGREVWPTERRRVSRRYNGQYRGGLRTELRNLWEKMIRAFIWVLIRIGIALAIASLMTGVYLYGQANAQTVDYVAPQQPTVEIKQAQMAPVLARIARAESHGSQLCTKEIADAKWSPSCNSGTVGQVMLHANNDGSVDIGKYGINNYAWGAEAARQHLNLTVEADNQKMAEYIFENFGTEPWYSSKKNWK